MKVCKGLFKPLYSIAKYTSKNPFYLTGNCERIDGVNTADEFITVSVYKEIGTVCVDCKKAVCKREEYGQKKEEIG
jgi:hypothetical protein